MFAFFLLSWKKGQIPESWAQLILHCLGSQVSTNIPGIYVNRKMTIGKKDGFSSVFEPHSLNLALDILELKRSCHQSAGIKGNLCFWE